MEVAKEELLNALNSIRGRRVEKAELDAVVQKALDETKVKADGAPIQNTTWEFLLRTEILSLAATEGQALQDSTSSSTYYSSLSLLLDLTLTFTESGACEPSTPLATCQDLLETQTISSCSHIFSWIQSRDARLTKDMIPQKGKALVLLRTLNELLRRLSKMGERNTEFCGRILIFLSQAFPLGERSGVNLRGEYGPPWDGPVAKSVNSKGEKEGEDKDKMTVDESPEALEEVKKEDFYYTFWSLQQPFARPNVFADPTAFPAFKESVSRVLPFIKEATAKERAMMGNKSASGNNNLTPSTPLPVVSIGSKRKRDGTEAVDESSSLKSYFFAKFLTSPDLLDLEIADTHFRRQFLFQLLTILQHLLTHTKTAKQAASKAGNKPLHITEFTLEPTDAQWVQEIQLKCIEELKQTAPNGRLFADSVTSVLEREKSWVRWKNEQCMPFDKEPWSEEIVVDIGDGESGEGEGGSKVKSKVGFEEATRKKRTEMMADPEEWEHKFGTAPLTEIWEMGYRDLMDLQRPFQPGEVKDFAKKIKMEDARINLRRQQLEKIAQHKARALTQAKQKAETDAKDVKMSDLTSESSAPTATSAPPVIAQPVPTMPSQNALHPSLPLKPAPSPAPSPAPAAVTQLQVQPQVRSTPPPPVLTQPSNLPPDSIIAKHEESKHRWSWIALRTARDRYLQHFGKIGPGDIVQLEVEIEKEKREKEEAEAEAEAAAAMKVDSVMQNGNGNEENKVPGPSEPVNGSGAARAETIGDTVQADGDANMGG